MKNWVEQCHDPVAMGISDIRDSRVSYVVSISIIPFFIKKYGFIQVPSAGHFLWCKLSGFQGP